MDYWGLDGDLFEFIEITNNGSNTVDLTGVYFRELGITYRFPNGSSIAPHDALLLCSDSLTFVDYYGRVPFGQYTRKLSNKSENLVLADAWGNIIDEVHYYDSEPWPTEADGNGPYLELKDLDSDNSLAENWTVGNDINKVEEGSAIQSIALYPNPTNGQVHIEAKEMVATGQVVDMMGNVVYRFSPVSSSFQLDVNQLSKGIYFLKMTTLDGQTLHSKFIKQ